MKERRDPESEGYLAKLGFWFKIKARVKILPQAYSYYSEDKIFTRIAEFGRKDNFSRYPETIRFEALTEVEPEQRRGDTFANNVLA